MINTSNSSFRDIVSFVFFILNAGTLVEEFHRRNVRWLEVAPKEHPQTLLAALKPSYNLPNVYTLIKLFVPLPLSSCSWEHSVSAQIVGRNIHKHFVV